MGLAHHLPSVVLHHTYWLTVSRDYRVLGRSLEFADVFMIGTSVWMSNPLLERILTPAYERAWLEGSANGMELIRGMLCRYKLSRGVGEMHAEFEYIDRLDVSTFTTLRESLNRLADTCSTGHVQPQAPRHGLRVV